VVFALRQQRLDRKLADIEQARRAEEVSLRLAADVTAAFESEPRRGSPTAERHYLVLTNRGAAPARDVDIDYPTGERMPTVWKEGIEFPITLDPEQRFRVPAAPGGYGESLTLAVTISWTDNRGPQKKTLTLALH
jgi:hypothetical protein